VGGCVVDDQARAEAGTHLEVPTAACHDYLLVILDFGTIQLVKRGEFQKAEIAMRTLHTSVAEGIPNQCLLQCYRIDLLHMGREPNIHQEIKKILSFQGKLMKSLDCKYDDDWCRVHLRHYYYKAHNALDCGNVQKAIKFCGKALDYGREVYPENCETILRLVAHP
jgi:hypothetical protein